MKNGRNFSRKEFIKTIAFAGFTLPLFQFCARKSKSFLLRITSTNHVLGHRLWAKDFPKPSETIRSKFLIIGSGVTALSAARYLSQQGIKDFLLVEMEQHIGGNSSAGENQWSKYPLGAHYLPFPNKSNRHLIDLLEEFKIILGYDDLNRPIFDEEQLTFPPHERIHHKNMWEDQLFPKDNLEAQYKEEFDRFFESVNDFRHKRDSLGCFWFDIPIEHSSRDEEALALERITFSVWLQEHNFESEALLWYLNYCCKDDYGLGIDYVSAWAGIHYFAGRKDDLAPHYNAREFTWPEGNERLVHLLSKYVEGKVLTKHLAFDFKTNESEVEIHV